MLTIVMYHYVRDPAGTPFAGLKTRTPAEFVAQLDLIAARYEVVRMKQVVAALSGGPPLPANAALLTFDDGYREHYTVVLPELMRRGWQGCFFPVVDAVVRRRVLLVNQIHFILATGPDLGGLVRRILEVVATDGRQAGLPSPETFYAQLARPGRFDGAEVTFVKRALQRELPAPIRSELCSVLFDRYVTSDARGFAEELYLASNEVRALHAAGMYIGGHTATHPWLDRMAPHEQAWELEQTRAFLAAHAAAENWVMAYPYGAFNAETVALLPRYGAAAALTTRVAIARLGPDERFALPRLDTNDLRCDRAESRRASERRAMSPVR